MKKKLLTLFVGLLLVAPFSLSANQAYIGLGLVPTSGQPDYIADGYFNINMAFETSTLWRFSFTNTSFMDKDEDSNKLKSMIFGAERMWVYKINTGKTLIGTFGPGLYSTTAEGAYDGSGMALGLIATGSFRFAITDKLFIGAAAHYKNAAVVLNDEMVVHGGYNLFSLFVNIGYFF